MSRTKTLLIVGAVLVAAAVLVAVILLTEPTAERSGAVRESAMLVEVTGVERGTFRPEIRATGTVLPSQEVIVSPRVAGEVVRQAGGFTPGGTVRRGEVLLQIDPADYRNALEQRRSELRQAQSDLAVEEGRQNVARQDFELLGEEVAEANRDLVLRRPQLEAAEARVASARAAVEQAELALQRTTIRAPFDAHVLRRGATVGSQVAPGDDLGHLVATDAYWVETTVPVSVLQWIDLPENASGGADVRLRNRTAWDEGVYRRGQLYRLVGALEEDTRMARVLVRVPDPRGTGTTGAPPLILGSFVETLIEGRPLSDVVRLDRDHVRDDDTAWVMERDTLRIRDLRIVMRDAEHAYVRGGLAPGDRVVTTNLSTVVDGAPLRLEDDRAATDASAANASATD